MHCPPKNAKEGAVWFNPETNNFYRFNGTTWDAFIPDEECTASNSTEEDTDFFIQKNQQKILFKLIITEEERILLEKIIRFLHMDVSEAIKTIVN